MFLKIIPIPLLLNFQYTNLFLVDRFNRNNLVVDISRDCEEGYFTSVRLSYGYGSTDARVLLLRSLDEPRNCSVMVSTSKKISECGFRECFVIIVAEFFNYKPLKTFCHTFPNTTFKAGIHDVKKDICKDTSRNKPVKYHIQRYLIHKNDFAVEMAFSNFSGTIKITVTSTKYLGSYGTCNSTTEVRCIIQSKKTCISKHLKCDGNFNCGLPNYEDEYCMQRSNRQNLLYAVIYFLGLLAIVIVFFIQILRVCNPSMGEHFFIFNEGEENKFVLKTQSFPPLELEKEKETAKTS